MTSFETCHVEAEIPTVDDLLVILVNRTSVVAVAAGLALFTTAVS